MEVDLKGVEQLDFSGGMSDFLSAPDPNQVEILDNFMLTEETKPIQRSGSRPIDAIAYTAANANKAIVNEKIANILNYKNDAALIFRAKDKLYSWIGNTQSEIVSESSNKAFLSTNQLTSNTIGQALRWHDHALFTAFDPSTEIGVTPKKVFKTKFNTFQVRDASILPVGKMDSRGRYALEREALYFKRTVVHALGVYHAITAHFGNSGTLTSWHPVVDPTYANIYVGPDLSEEELCLTTISMANIVREHIKDARKTSPSYHAANTGGSIYFGNFELQQYETPRTFRECIPILNNVAAYLTMHQQAFEIQSFASQQHPVHTTKENDLYLLFPTSATNSFEPKLSENYFQETTLGTEPAWYSNYSVIKPNISLDDYIHTLVSSETTSTFVTLYNAHINHGIHSVGPTTGELLQVTTIPTIRCPSQSWINLFQMLIGYTNHINATTRHASTSVTDAEKLASFTSINDFYQGETTGFLNLFDIYSASAYTYFITQYIDLYTKIVLHTPLARHPTPGYNFLNYGGNIRYPESYTIGGVQFALTAKASYRTDQDTEFEDESEPWVIIYRALFTKLNDKTISQFGETPINRLRGTGYIPSFITAFYGPTTDTYGNQPVNVTLTLYRTAVGGTTFYKLLSGSSVDCANFVDAKLDTELSGAGTIYTTGGVVENNPLPESRSATILQDRAYFGGTRSKIGISFWDTVEDGATDTITTKRYGITARHGLKNGDRVQFFTKSLSTFPMSLIADGDATGFYIWPGLIFTLTVGQRVSIVDGNSAATVGYVMALFPTGRVQIEAVQGSGTPINCTAYTTAQNAFITTLNSTPALSISGQDYFVINVTDTTLQVATTPTGSAVDIPTGDYDLSLGMVSYKYETALNRVMQSINGNPFYSPSTFYVDLDSNVQILGQARGYPIVVCAKGVYRLEGVFNEDGTGEVIARLISERVHGIGHNSGITVNDLFYFAAIDGFYRCDGFSVQNLIPHLKPSYSDYTDPDQNAFSARNEQIQAGYDPILNHIHWSMTPVGSTPTETWVLHLDHTKEKASFATMNGPEFYPTALEFYKGKIIRGTNDGFLFEHSREITSDPKVSSGSLQLDGAQELLEHIPFNLKTQPKNFGSYNAKKIIPRVEVLLYPATKLNATLTQENDLNGITQSLKDIVYTNAAYKGIIRERRSYASGSNNTGGRTGLRAILRQLAIGPRISVLAKAGLVNTSGTTVNLLSGAFPTNLKGCTIYFNGGATPYTISSRVSGTQLTLGSSPGSLTNATYEIWGYPVDEQPQIIGFIDHIEGAEGQAYGGQEGDGGN